MAEERAPSWHFAIDPAQRYVGAPFNCAVVTGLQRMRAFLTAYSWCGLQLRCSAFCRTQAVMSVPKMHLLALPLAVAQKRHHVQPPDQLQ